MLDIIINGDKGKKEMKALTEATRKLKSANKSLVKQQKSLMDAGKGNTAACRKLTAEMQDNNNAIVIADKRMEELRKQYSITEMSISDLRKEKSRLMRLLNTSKPNTENWAKYRSEIKKVDAQLEQLGVQGKMTSQSVSLSGMANKFNHYSGVVVASLATMTGVYMTASTAKDKFLERDDRYADVMKTTGLLRDEVVSLDDSLKNLDTRTAQDELLQLMVIAGKLGIEGEQNLLRFAKAADIIKVSLGADLGDDAEAAIRQIGKLTDIFGLLDTMGIDEAMLKIGSAINDVGASSTASEQYVVNFLYRMGAVSKQVKQSVADAVGLASLLDTRGQRSEMASTAVSKLMREMTIQTSSFAKIAKMEMAEYAELIDTDFNSAFVKVLESLGQLDTADFSNTLKGVGISGSEATTVIASLAKSTEGLAEHQKIANDAFRDGTSVVKEFTIKNTSLAAEQEKRIKIFGERVVELGEKIMPLFGVMTTGSSLAIKAFIALIDFMGRYGIAIISLISALTAYNIAVNAATIDTKIFTAVSFAGQKIMSLWKGVCLLASAGYALMTGNIAGATVAMQGFNLVTKLNSIGLLIGLLTAGVTAFIAFSSKAETAAISIEKIRKASAKTVENETRSLKLLISELENETTSRSRKSEIVDELTLAISKSMSAFDGEAISIENASDALDRYIDLKELEAQKVGNQEKIDDLQSKKGKYKPSVLTVVNAAISSDPLVSLVADAKSANASLIAQIDGLEKQNLEVQNKINEIRNSNQGASPIGKNPSDVPSTPTTTPGTIGGEIERINKEIEILNNQRLIINVEDVVGLKTVDDKIQKLKKSLSELNNPKVEPNAEGDVLVNQEIANYQKRLEQYGLFNKKFDDMTRDEQSVYQALKSEHMANLSQIDRDHKTSTLNSLIISLNDAVAIMQNKHKLQLANSKLNAEERKALVKTQMSELATLMASGCTDITSEMEKAIGSKSLNGLLGIDKDIQQGHQDEVGQAIANKTPAGAEFYGPLDEKSRGTQIPLIGGTAGEWEDFFNSFDDWTGSSPEEKAQLIAAAIAKSFQVISAAFGAMNQIMTAKENKELDNFEKNQKSKENTLKRQLDAGAISQDMYNAKMTAMQEEMDKKREEADLKQAKRNKVQAILEALTATSLAVAQALPNIPLSIVVGALGLAQVAMIAAIPVASGYEEGGYTMRDDGNVFKTKNSGRKSGYVGQSGAEYIVGESGGEFIVNNKSLRDPAIASLVQDIDRYQRNGHLNAPKLPPKGYPAHKGYQDGGYTVAVSKKTSSKKDNLPDNELAEKTLAAINLLSDRISRPIEAVISNKKLQESQDKFNKAKKKL